MFTYPSFMYEPSTPPSFYPRTRNYPSRQQKQPEASTYNTNYQPKKSFKVKIQSDEDETKAKINAAHKIYNFIKNQSANKQTHKILNKLYILHKIENELKEIQKTKYLGNLTFDKENGKQILPISIDNKNFLEYENKIVKSFDKLDEIQSEGVDIIRDRRKFLVKFAQTLLDELDIEKENQWKKMIYYSRCFPNFTSNTFLTLPSIYQYFFLYGPPAKISSIS
ncbi:3450_t:CDS:2 [Rhizophagus irregularis]|nr:3450_t:CDS:2 [Rhizophagus irregularis]